MNNHLTWFKYLMYRANGSPPYGIPKENKVLLMYNLISYPTVSPKKLTIIKKQPLWVFSEHSQFMKMSVSDISVDQFVYKFKKRLPVC